MLPPPLTSICAACLLVTVTRIDTGSLALFLRVNSSSVGLYAVPSTGTTVVLTGPERERLNLQDPPTRRWPFSTGTAVKNASKEPTERDGMPVAGPRRTGATGTESLISKAGDGWPSGKCRTGRMASQMRGAYVSIMNDVVTAPGSTWITRFELRVQRTPAKSRMRGDTAHGASCAVWIEIEPNNDVRLAGLRLRMAKVANADSRRVSKRWQWEISRSGQGSAVDLGRCEAVGAVAEVGEPTWWWSERENILLGTLCPHRIRTDRLCSCPQERLYHPGPATVKLGN
ncbi:hypothetical protein B0H13DRAFT_2272703 [Mycena leptocephala]|nr:hypothetical protein B0H13DRAFT_2272703 [Mycena leptocephala]